MHVNDEPIRRSTEDILSRSSLAATIAAELRYFDASAGLVVGVMGPGKFDNAAMKLETYGEVFAPLQVVPVVGSWLGRASAASKALKEFRETRLGSVGQKRFDVSIALQKLESPIVIGIDDIDRLHTNEIRDIFKLIRLTANFPNIIYLVAFDRMRVEQALGEDSLPGRDYLEKIVQVVYDLPEIPDIVLHQAIKDALAESIFDQGIEGYFTPDRWMDIFLDVIASLISNVRQVRRYAGSVRATVVAMARDIDVFDLLAMEAVRIFMPDVFRELSRNQTALTASGRGLFDIGWEERQKFQLEQIVSLAGEQQYVVKNLLARLFPDASRLMGNSSAGVEDRSRYARDRRVADPAIFASYFDRFSDVRLQPLRDADRVFQAL